MTPTVGRPTNAAPEGTFESDIARTPPARPHRPAYQPEELDKSVRRDGFSVVWAMLLIVIVVGAVALVLTQLFG